MMNNNHNDSQNQQEDDRLIDRKAAAKLLGFSPASLAVWDCKGTHDLHPVKIGRSVRYRMSVLRKILDDRMKP